jgi:hypothetical protein
VTILNRLFTFSVPAKLIVLLVVVAIHTQNAWAQERCGVVPYMHTLRNNQQLPESDVQFEKWLSKAIQERKARSAGRIQSTYQIPVVVHIIHNGEAVGSGTNIPDAQVLSQIRVLNADYQRTNSDASSTPAEFASLAGSMNIQFVLAKRTPDGFPTNGIVRVKGTQSSWTSDEDVEMKALSYWSSEEYLNIWVCDLTDYIGYSQFPISDLPGLEPYQGGLAKTDGVVFNYRVFGSIQDGAFNLHSSYNRGRTATHEIGHFFGLRHIWGDVNSCSSTDYVNDTPTQDKATNDCPTHPSASCNATKMFQNYMDYTYDRCMNLFTEDQVARMTTVLENSPRRESLLSSPGLLEPNIDGNDLLIKSIVSPAPVLCNTSVAPKLIVKVNNSVEPITSFVVNYTINGTYNEVTHSDFTLEEGDEISVELPVIELEEGDNTLVFEMDEPNGGIDVNPYNNTYETTVIVKNTEAPLPLRESFEGTLSDAWTIINPTKGMDWQTTDLDDNGTLYFNASSNVNTEDQAWFVSPVMNLANTKNPVLSFETFYQEHAGYLDALTVRASTGCSPAFDIVLLELESSQLASADEFKRHIVSLGPYRDDRDFRIAFVFSNGNGSNLYLDNIEVSEPGQFSLYPNPADDEVNVVSYLVDEQAVDAEITDAVGQRVLSQTFTTTFNTTTPIPLAACKPGIYFLRIKTSTGMWTSRLVVK